MTCYVERDGGVSAYVALLDCWMKYSISSLPQTNFGLKCCRQCRAMQHSGRSLTIRTINVAQITTFQLLSRRRDQNVAHLASFQRFPHRSDQKCCTNYNILATIPPFSA